MSPKRLLRWSWYRHHVLNLVVGISVAIILAGTITNAISNRDQVRQNHRLAVNAQHTAKDLRQAVCALRHERQRAVANSRQFLQDHPNGIDGISVADIQASIALQQGTVRALRFAHCPPLKPET